MSRGYLWNETMQTLLNAGCSELGSRMVVHKLIDLKEAVERVKELEDYLSWFVRSVEWRDHFDLPYKDIDIIRLEIEANGSDDSERDTFLRVIDAQREINKDELKK